jgi:hypothetical protein
MAARTRFFALALSGALVALPALAETYTLTLKNGNTFLTRYQPQDASWDAEKLVFLDEFGNQIALAKSDVDTLTTEFESRGFGHVLNSTTVAIGWAPNDAIDPDSDEGKAAAALDSLAGSGQQAPPPVYNQEQFVEPSATGGGLPASFLGPGGPNTPPMSGSGGAPAEPVTVGSTPPPGQ